MTSKKEKGSEHWKEIKVHLDELCTNNENGLFEEGDAWLSLASLKSSGVSSSDLEQLTIGIQARVIGKGPQKLRYTITELKREYYPFNQH
jgi:hypothetical protein